jgi:HK97 family phage major capsid protein
MMGKTAAQLREQMNQPGGKRLADRIVALELELVTYKDAINEILEACELDDRDPTEEETAEIQAANDAIEQRNNAVAAYKTAEQAAAGRASRNVPAILRNKGEKERKKGDFLIKTATATLHAFINKGRAEESAEFLYANDAQAVDVIKSIVNPGSSTAAGWAAELVQYDVQGFLDLLYGVSVYARLEALGLGLNFNGFGSIKVPGRAPTPTMAGAFVSELGLIPVKRLGLISATLNRYKLGVIGTYSRELFEQSTPNIETIIRDATINDTAQAIDTALLDTNPQVNGVRPAGLRNGCTTAAGAAGGGVNAIIQDVQGMIGTMTAANGGRRPVWVLHPTVVSSLTFAMTATGVFLWKDEVEQGRFCGYPLVSSTHADPTVALLVDCADFVSAFDTPMFMASQEATIIEVNDDGTVPSMDVASGGISPIHNINDALAAVPPGTVRSLYQTDALALRMLWPVSWHQFRVSTSVVARTAITWMQ